MSMLCQMLAILQGPETYSPSKKREEYTLELWRDTQLS